MFFFYLQDYEDFASTFEDETPAAYAVWTRSQRGARIFVPALPVRISSHLASISLMSAVGKSVT